MTTSLDFTARHAFLLGRSPELFYSERQLPDTSFQWGKACQIGFRCFGCAQNLSDSESEDDEPTTKKPKWFESSKLDRKEEDDKFLEIEEPQSLEDLEALTQKLLQG